MKAKASERESARGKREEEREGTCVYVSFLEYI
jgi:hypothetical protein